MASENARLQMGQVERLLIVEDQRDDQLRASEIARAIGIGIIEARSSCAAARSLIEQGLRGEVSLPGAIVLDLDLGYESGHEFLRFWYTTPGASKIPLIVWSRLGGDHKQICEAFKINGFVSKHDGMEVLREALMALGSAASNKRR